MASAGRSPDSHRFRFFVEAAATAGVTLPLERADVEHARVLRLDPTTPVDLVDGAGAVWDARIEGELVRPVAVLSCSNEPAAIELVAGALVGGRFDELVDGAVQAGAARIIPLALNRRDRERLAARRSRLCRIARAAAKQAQRSVVPDVTEPIDLDALLAGAPGVVLDAGAPVLLSRVLDARAVETGASGVTRLLVGPAEGLERAVVAQLTEAGWQRARLGPTILRAELAAAVTVAIAAMHLPSRQEEGRGAADVAPDG